MLVLTRRVNEAITLTVGDVTIRVVVKSIKSSQMRIGIDAPESVHILREEVPRKSPKVETSHDRRAEALRRLDEQFK